MSLKTEIDSTIKSMDPNLSRNDEYFKAASLLLFVAKTGCFNKVTIRKEMEIESSLVAKFVYNLRKSKVFVRRDIHADWGDPENGGCAFWMDVTVACGLLERA